MNQYIAWLFLGLSTVGFTATGDASVYTIGNSLTWDTRPADLDDAEWHVFCGKNLDYISENPNGHCVSSSDPWPEALTDNTYDYISVQPDGGTTLARDVEVISNWMDMQPSAIFVLHTGWDSPTIHPNSYLDTDVTTMKPSEAYFDALERELAKEHPGREIRRTRAAEALFDIASDIEAGIAPYSSLSELYRDHIHMSHSDGRYLMHNLMRLAVDQDMVLTLQADATPSIDYLNQKLRAYAVPEPASATLLVLGALTLHIRRRVGRPNR